MIMNKNIKRIIVSVLTFAFVIMSLAGCTGGTASGGGVSGNGVKIFYTTPVLDDFKNPAHSTELPSPSEQSAQALTNRLNRFVKLLLPVMT